MLRSEGKADEAGFLQQVALHPGRPEEGEGGISGRESRGEKTEGDEKENYSWNMGDLSGVDSGDVILVTCSQRHDEKCRVG